ncbi:MAG: tetratricopeptide repeat protein [Rhodomicrobium sp.]
MPAIGGLHLLIAIGLAVHAMKTGRNTYWMYILVFVPVVGAIAYVMFELVPELAGTRRAREVQANIGTILDPDREWRERVHKAELVDSVDAKRALAEECMRKGRWDDAIALFQAAAQGIFADDPSILAGLAEAQLGAGNAAGALSTLDRLREAHPQAKNQEAHLLYALALEAAGRIGEALSEYEAVSRYFAGFEARVRWGLLLLKEGQPTRAMQLFNEVVRASKVRGILITPRDKPWIKVARSQLH